MRRKLLPAWTGGTLSGTLQASGLDTGWIDAGYSGGLDCAS